MTAPDEARSKRCPVATAPELSIDTSKRSDPLAPPRKPKRAAWRGPEKGRRAALRHYIRLTALLQDLELEPEEETVELYERIRSADIVPGSSDVAVPGG